MSRERDIGTQEILERELDYGRRLFDQFFTDQQPLPRLGYSGLALIKAESVISNLDGVEAEFNLHLPSIRVGSRENHVSISLSSLGAYHLEGVDERNVLGRGTYLSLSDIPKTSFFCR